MVTSKLITNLIECETQNLSEEILQSGRKVHIVSTSTLATIENYEWSKNNSKEISPFDSKNVLLAFFLLLNVIGLSLAISQLMQTALPSPLFVGLLLGFLLLFLGLVTSLIKAGKKSKIRKISVIGIYTTDINLTWPQLAETLIMKVPVKRSFNRYLVLITHQNLVLKFEINGYLMNDQKLASAIEHFKSKADHQKSIQKM